MTFKTEIEALSLLEGLEFLELLLLVHLLKVDLLVDEAEEDNGEDDKDDDEREEAANEGEALGQLRLHRHARSQ